MRAWLAEILSLWRRSVNATLAFPKLWTSVRFLIPDRQQVQQYSLAAAINADLEALEQERKNIEDRRKEVDKLIEAALKAPL